MHVYAPSTQPGQPPVLIAEKEYVCLRFGGRNRVYPCPETFEDAEVLARQLFPALANRAFVFETDALPISAGATVEVDGVCWTDFRPALRQLDIKVFDEHDAPVPGPQATILTPQPSLPVQPLNRPSHTRAPAVPTFPTQVADALSKSASIFAKASPVAQRTTSLTTENIYETASQSVNVSPIAGPSRLSNIFIDSSEVSVRREPVTQEDHDMNVDTLTGDDAKGTTPDDREFSLASESERKRKRDPSEDQEEGIVPRRRVNGSSWPAGFQGTPEMNVPAERGPALRVSQSPLPSFGGSGHEQAAPPSPPSAPFIPVTKQERVAKAERMDEPPRASGSSSGPSRSQPAAAEPRPNKPAPRSPQQQQPSGPEERFVIRVYPPGGPEAGKHKAFRIRGDFTIAKVLLTACKSFGYLTTDGKPTCRLALYADDDSSSEPQSFLCDPKETVFGVGARDKAEFELVFPDEVPDNDDDSIL